MAGAGARVCDGAGGRGLNVGAKAAHVLVFSRERGLLEEEQIHPVL